MYLLSERSVGSGGRKAAMNFVWQFPATVDRIVDGDTVVAHVHFTAEDERHGVNIRIEGINALELSERFGGEAKAKAESLLPVGTEVILVHRRREKYGRLLAKVTLPDGTDFSDHMLAALASDGITHLAKPYLV